MSASSLDGVDPVAVALKFGFLAVLYLFLFWVARSALQELRRTTAPAPEATGFYAALDERRAGRRRTPGSSSRRAAGSTPGERYDLFGGATIGRSTDADVRIEDRYASGSTCASTLAGAATTSRT